MKACSRSELILVVAFLLLLTPGAGQSEEWQLEERPWEKFGANLGVFISAVDSSFRIGTGVGLDNDLKGNVGFDYTGLQLYLRIFY